MGRRQPSAGVIEKKSGQQTRVFRAELDVTSMGIRRQARPGQRPSLRVDDCRMLPVVSLSLVPDFSDVDWIGQELVDFSAGECSPSVGSPAGDGLGFRAADAAAD